MPSAAMACDVARQWMSSFCRRRSGGSHADEDQDDRIVFEGWIAKKSRHLGVWRKRWAVITPSHFVTFQDDDYDRKGTDATEMIPLSQLKTVSRNEENDLVLLVNGPHGKFNLCLRCLSSSKEGEIAANRLAIALIDARTWSPIEFELVIQESENFLDRNQRTLSDLDLSIL
eukprot:gnl/MRDRNA2_/MRDRNA2_102312_c0_seq1.p1 gnl/MRDRNA2_/MRDRNA2_102312_c0~~gnl/MRDRNA2_/MRDRNA2_102312_c0_seq1.p1  ORF type:complete len:172 (-),score=18.62 gnl/MRDRNA2_/MRDRNA2_102312_c0_seq1:486-1001(-)